MAVQAEVALQGGSMRILAFDPGKNDFAWAALHKDGRLKARGFIRTITTMTFGELEDELARFCLDIERLLDRHNPDFVAVERMQHRKGKGGGAVDEYINVMIGILLATARTRRIKTMCFPSATWKSAMMKAYGRKKHDFAMATQKLRIPAPKGATRQLKGKAVKVKTQTVLVQGVLAGQPGHDNADPPLTAHEGDAIGIGCHVWARITGIDPSGHVLT